MSNAHVDAHRLAEQSAAQAVLLRAALDGPFEPDLDAFAWSLQVLEDLTRRTVAAVEALDPAVSRN